MTFPFRRGAAALVVGIVACMGAASAAPVDGCGPRDVRKVVAAVPFFETEMALVGTPSASEATYAHPDDDRIAVTLRLAGQARPPVQTRAAFVQELRRSIDGLSQPEGASMDSAVFPYDPVAWSVVRRGSAEKPLSTGETDVRMSPTCRLVLDWQAPETPALQARLARFVGGLDALRVSSATQSEPSGFVDDDYVPTGARALLIGFLLPAVVAGLLSELVTRLAGGRTPTAACRAALTWASAASVAGVALQWHAIMSGFADGLADARYVDTLALLATLACVAGAAAATGRPRLVAAAMTLTLVAGYSLAAAAYLNWVPVRLVSLPLAGVLVAAACVGLWSWLGRRLGGSRQRAAQAGA